MVKFPKLRTVCSRIFQNPKILDKEEEKKNEGQSEEGHTKIDLKRDRQTDRHTDRQTHLPSASSKPTKTVMAPKGGSLTKIKSIYFPGICSDGFGSPREACISDGIVFPSACRTVTSVCLSIQRWTICWPVCVC